MTMTMTDRIDVESVMENITTSPVNYIKKNYNNNQDVHVIREATIQAKEQLLECYTENCSTLNYDLIDDMNTLLNAMDRVIKRLAIYYGTYK